MSAVIQAEHLSKVYHIGVEHSGSFRETVSESVRKIFHSKEKNPTEFWALKDVSFEVKQGEVVGIIGKNGAGKSTLLKILSRITEPSEGKVVINGRVASLLEVGTGFHAELTGRENIFMNGAILGMKKAEIRKKFDEIVDFSGIEKFIDTPVKRYSSGMYVRLAFAVAAHLEPEILIVDEVLAVGDAEFQKKCLGKMKDVSEHDGRTVLFVSHNMTAVNSLCGTCILIERGAIKTKGEVETVTTTYLKNIGTSVASKEWGTEQNSDDVVRATSLRVIDRQFHILEYIPISKNIGVEFTYRILRTGRKPIPNIHIFTASGEVAFVAVDPSKDLPIEEGDYKSIMWIPSDFLNEGVYTIGVALSTLNPTIIHFSDYQALSIEVVDNLEAITRNEFTGRFRGAVRPLLNWQTEKLTEKAQT